MRPYALVDLCFKEIIPKIFRDDPEFVFLGRHIEILELGFDLTDPLKCQFFWGGSHLSILQNKDVRPWTPRPNWFISDCMPPKRNERVERRLRFEFGQSLRALRKAKGLTQESIADKANVDRSYMGRIERGEVELGLRYIYRIAAALAISPRKLFKNEVPRLPDIN